MESHVYILHSSSLNQYYIGSTIIPVGERIERHLVEYYGDKKFTAKAKDWISFFSIECKSKEQAVQVENHIKRMKSKKYIENLSKYPEMVHKLLERYLVPGSSR